LKPNSALKQPLDQSYRTLVDGSEVGEEVSDVRATVIARRAGDDVHVTGRERAEVRHDRVVRDHHLVLRSVRVVIVICDRAEINSCLINLNTIYP